MIGYGRAMVELVNMNGRAVVLRPPTMNDHNHMNCGDCGSKTKFIVVELEPHAEIPQWQPVWGWCGECEIGG